MFNLTSIQAELLNAYPTFKLFLNDYAPARLLIIYSDIFSIDQSYSQKVDKDQLWSEALALYESNSFEYIFSKKDYEEFNDYNQRYKYETPAMYYAQLYLEEDNIAGEKLNATQIVERLLLAKKIRSKDISEVTPQKMGYALAVLGYTRSPYRDPANNNKATQGYRVTFKLN